MPTAMLVSITLIVEKPAVLICDLLCQPSFQEFAACKEIRGNLLIIAPIEQNGDETCV